MGSITITFTPWAPFQAVKDDAVVQAWLQDVGNKAVQAFRTGASRQWGGGKGSSPGEWPMRRSGLLLRTIRAEVSSDQVTVGSSGARGGAKGGFPYSAWLRDRGNKMSEEALKLGLHRAHLGHWVHWESM